MNYEIEKGIEIPATTKKYPWNDMEVGDSFFIPDGEKQGASASHRTRYGEAHVTRKVEGGIRIWRTK